MKYDIGISDESERYDHTPSCLAKSLFFYPICAGEYYYENGYSIQRARFIDSILMMYTVEGAGTLRYRGKLHRLERGDVALVDCSQPHGYHADDNWHILWMHFNGSSSKGYYDMLYSRCGCVTQTGGSPVVFQVFTSILDDFRNSRQISEPLVSCHIQRILTELTLLSVGSPSGSQRVSAIIQDAISFIESNYSDKISIKGLASQISVSEFYLSRLFRRETGYSPYEFVLKTRINAAKNLLRVEKPSVKEVAFAVGFGCEHSFITIFSKMVGMSPKTFRDSKF